MTKNNIIKNDNIKTFIARKRDNKKKRLKKNFT